MRYKITSEAARSNVLRLIGKTPHGFIVEIREENRSDEQNRLLHALIGDIVTQCKWHGEKLGKDAWRQIFVAAVMKENGKARVIQGMDGEPLTIAPSSRRLTKSEFSDLITLVEAYGAEHGVVFSDHAMEAYQTYREAQ